MEKKLRKSANKKVCGVCAGLAEYFDLDVTLVRVICAVSLIFGVLPVVLIYFIMAAIMPDAEV